MKPAVSRALALSLVVLCSTPLYAKGSGRRGGGGGKGKVRSAAPAGSAATVSNASGKKFAPKSKADRQAMGHTGAGTLYVTDGAGSGNSNLYTVDPATTSYTLVGPVGFGVTAMEYDHTSGILYGATNNSSVDPASLITINTTTGAGTLVGPLGIVSTRHRSGTARTPTVADLAIDETGTLYGWAAKNNAYDLYTINKTTGAAAKVGEAEIASLSGEGLTIAAGQMYLAGWGHGPFMTVDPASGEIISHRVLSGMPSQVTPVGAHQRFSGGLSGLTVNSAGTVYGIAQLYNAGELPSHLVILDPASGDVTDVGATTSPAIDAIEFNKTTGVLYAADKTDAGFLYTVNPATGATTPVGGPLGIGITGLAHHPTTGVMYGVSSNQAAGEPMLVTVNTTTGVATAVGELNVIGTRPSDGSTSEQPLADIEFSPTGVLYGLARGYYTDDIYTINLTSGQATKVGEADIHGTNGNGLAWVNGDLVAAPFGGAGTLLNFTPASGEVEDRILRNLPFIDMGRFMNSVNGMTASDDGSIYATAKVDGRHAPDDLDHLVQIDPDTGIVIDLGELLEGLDAIAYTNQLLIADQSVPGIPTVSFTGLAITALLLSMAAFVAIRLRA